MYILDILLIQTGQDTPVNDALIRLCIFLDKYLIVNVRH